MVGRPVGLSEQRSRRNARAYGRMRSDERDCDYSPLQTVCQNCGQYLRGADICARCGASSASSSLSRGDTVQALPENDRIDSYKRERPRSQHSTCSECNDILVKRPSQTGTVMVIAGLGLLIVGTPLVKSFLASVLGFLVMGIGIWKQANPRMIKICPSCHSRAK